MVVPLRGVVILVFVDGALGNIGDCFAFSQPTCNMCESSHCMAEGIVLGRAKTIPDNGLLLQQPTSNQYPRFALKAFEGLLAAHGRLAVWLSNRVLTALGRNVQFADRGTIQLSSCQNRGCFEVICVFLCSSLCCWTTSRQYRSPFEPILDDSNSLPQIKSTWSKP